jgi:hypothetical protein
VRDGDGAEHELTVVACAGMVCIQDQERREPAYVMPAAAALQLGLQLIRACLTIRRSRLRRPARRGLVH